MAIGMFLIVLLLMKRSRLQASAALAEDFSSCCRSSTGNLVLISHFRYRVAEQLLCCERIGGLGGLGGC